MAKRIEQSLLLSLRAWQKYANTNIILALAILSKYMLEYCNDTDFRTGNASLCPWERHFTLVSHWGPSSLRVVVAWPDERLANRTQKVLCVGEVRQTQSAWFIRTNEQ